MRLLLCLLVLGGSGCGQEQEPRLMFTKMRPRYTSFVGYLSDGRKITVYSDLTGEKLDSVEITEHSTHWEGEGFLI